MMKDEIEMTDKKGPVMKIVLGLVTLSLVGVLAAADLQACGEKYLVPGRGWRFLPTPAERGRASVLVYAPVSSALSRTLTQLKADAALRKAGYRPTVVTTPADLDRVKSTPWDVVVVDVADGAALTHQMPGATKAQLVAVLADATKVQASLARAHYPQVMKSPSHNQDLLDAIDEAAGQAYLNQQKAAKKH
jgi:hypothetical protein